MATPEPLIRPPVQRRSQESLERVLDAGFKVLQERGLDGFTLQEVSQRAGVSIGSIYGRVPGKEALIMAIYERAMAWAEEEDDGLRAIAQQDLAPRERIEAIVAYLANDLLAHRHILEVFMGEVPRTAYWSHRGSEKSQLGAARFARAVLELREDLRHPEPELAVDVAYRMVYCTIARRITHGPKFESSRQVSDKKLVRELSRAVADYLL
jgi:AcrR family transcriptional regulator